MIRERALPAGAGFSSLCGTTERREERMTEPTGELTPQERERGLQILRRCDAYSLLDEVLEEAAARGDIPHTEILENARAELLTLREDASHQLTRFRWEHGIPQPGERS
jgi:hypothetical protein